MDAVQLNVRLDRAVKERGDAVLAIAGSSPSDIIHRLWDKLAQGGGAYERISQALADEPAPAADRSPFAAGANMFAELGASLGLDPASFKPSGLDDHEALEQIEWEQLADRGLI